MKVVLRSQDFLKEEAVVVFPASARSLLSVDMTYVLARSAFNKHAHANRLGEKCFDLTLYQVISITFRAKIRVLS